MTEGDFSGDLAGTGVPPNWAEMLGLASRAAPELITAADDPGGGPYAREIEVMLKDLGLAAVFCVDRVPTLGFLIDDRSDVIDRLHAVLWNQGLMGALLVISGDTVRVLSLDRRPQPVSAGPDPRLVQVLSLLADGPTLRDLLERVEAGTYWLEHAGFFGPEQRIDAVLLSNIAECQRQLAPDLSGEVAHALVMQTIFIAYLEDRRIVGPDFFAKMSSGRHQSFAAILTTGDMEAFYDVFVYLRGAFDGNVFTAPGVLDTEEPAGPEVMPQHLAVLSTFREGRQEMSTGQGRFFGYNFQYIPIGLISAVYDRFLAAEAARRSAEGAFYTPMFLADMVVEQCWAELSREQIDAGRFLDPACGSGIFLVRLFQRLVINWSRTHSGAKPSWGVLVGLAERLHGGDINPLAVRIAAFSLYIALLEQMEPPDLIARMRRGALLPFLYRRTLRHEDFLKSYGEAYDVILGNPPWRGRPGQGAEALSLFSHAGGRLPVPEKEIAWAFVWKSLERLKSDGLLSLLLPAMGFLHNTKPDALLARSRLFSVSKVLRIINLADMCFQLFEGASRPTALIVLRPEPAESRPYRFDYWCPKADLNLGLRRILALSKADRMRLGSVQVERDPHILKRRLWTRGPDERLLQYLSTIEALSSWIVQLKHSDDTTSRWSHWMIGQGFKPARPDRIGTAGYTCKNEPEVGRYPYLSARGFAPLVLPPVNTGVWSSTQVHRSGFVEGFLGPHILIPQGVERADGRLRASFSAQDVTFQHSLQAIAFPLADERLGKVLTAVLNSRLAAWFFFHESANLGTDRAKVLQFEVLKLPFTRPEQMPDPERAASAADELVRMMDQAIEASHRLLRPPATIPSELDRWVYNYYGLDDRDVALIDDAFDYLIPAMQPRPSAGTQKIWRPSSPEQRALYANELCEGLKDWLEVPVEARLAALSSEVGILHLRMTTRTPAPYSEQGAVISRALMAKLADRVQIPLTGNFQLTPDLRIVIGEDLYLIKPIRQRFWLRSAALADVEGIAADLQRNLPCAIEPEGIDALR